MNLIDIKNVFEGYVSCNHLMFSDPNFTARTATAAESMIPKEIRDNGLAGKAHPIRNSRTDNTCHVP